MKTLSVKSGWFLAFVTVWNFLALFHTPVGAADRITIGYAQGSGLWPLWITNDGGYFKRNDLDVEFVFTGGSAVTMAGLVSGHLFVTAGGSAAGVSAVMRGAPLVLIGSCGRPPFSLFASDPSIKTVADLKGKVVATGSGQSDDLVLRDILRRNGMKYGDLQPTYQANQNVRYAAVLSQRAAAAVFSPPYDLLAKKANLRELVDFNTLGSPLMFCGVWTRKNNLEQRSATLEKVMQGLVQAVARFRQDKAYAIQVFNKYARNTDAELAEHTYRRQVNLVPVKPYVEAEGLKPLLDSVIEVNPELKNRQPTEFYDNRFVKRLDDTGFIDGLYK